MSMRVINGTGARLLLAIWAASCCLATLGCNKSSGRPGIVTVPVTGKVTLDGKPLSGADVMFTTAEGASFAGKTKEDGNYQLEGLAGRDAACQGKCQVIVSRFLKPDGSPLGPDEFPAIVEASESLPPKYSMPGNSELSADVPQEGGTFDFELAGQ